MSESQIIGIEDAVNEAMDASPLRREDHPVLQTFLLQLALSHASHLFPISDNIDRAKTVTRQALHIAEILYDHPSPAADCGANLDDSVYCAAIVRHVDHGAATLDSLMIHARSHKDEYADVRTLAEGVKAISVPLATFNRTPSDNTPDIAIFFKNADPALRLLLALEGVMAARRYLKMDNDDPNLAPRRAVATRWRTLLNDEKGALAGIFRDEMSAADERWHCLSQTITTGTVTQLSAFRAARRQTPPTP